MQTAKWSFRPGLAASLATLLMLPLLAGLGMWQIYRADEKQAIFEAYQARTTSAVLDLNAQATDVSPEQIQWRKATVRGRYVNSMTFLLDNQVYLGRAGYHVFSVLEIASGGRPILINRGWIEAGNYRNIVPEIPDVTEEMELAGIITAFPSLPGISPGVDAPPELMKPGVYRIPRIDPPAAEALLGKSVASYVLRLEPGSAAGFTRAWPEPGSGRERHLGYAFQWFSMAVVLVILYISLNLERRIPNEQ